MKWIRVDWTLPKGQLYVARVQRKGFTTRMYAVYSLIQGSMQLTICLKH